MLKKKVKIIMKKKKQDVRETNDSIKRQERKKMKTLIGKFYFSKKN